MKGACIAGVRQSGSEPVQIGGPESATVEHRYTVTASLGWGGILSYAPRKIVDEALLTRGWLLAKITRGHRLGVNRTYHQAVARVARPWKVAAVSDGGSIEGLELRPGSAKMLPFLLNAQFHPERLVDRQPEQRVFFRALTPGCARNGKYDL